MQTLRHLSIAAAVAAALGLASLASAQAPAPTNPADAQEAEQSTPSPDPSAASSPHQRDVTRTPATETAPNPNPEPDAASTPHQQGAVGDTPRDNVAGLPSIVGMDVKSPTGEMLGNVVTVVASTTGRYAIISTGNDTATAVPYEAVAPLVSEGRIVMDKTKLQNSPQVAQADLHDKANTKWRQEAETYWAGQSPGRIRSASPGTNPQQPQPKER